MSTDGEVVNERVDNLLKVYYDSLDKVFPATLEAAFQVIAKSHSTDVAVVTLLAKISTQLDMLIGGQAGAAIARGLPPKEH